MLTTLLHSAAFKGAMTGLVPAITIDLREFMRWDGSAPFTWNWRTALVRYAHGLIGGALTGAGLGALLG